MLWVASIVVAAVVLLALRDRWEAVEAAGGWPNLTVVALAVAANLLANGILTWTWRDMVALTGVRLPLGRATWIWASSQLSRYVIGGAQVAGRAVVGRRHGLSGTAGATTAVLEVALQFQVAGAVAMATLPAWTEAAGGLRWLAWIALAPTAVLGATIAAPVQVLNGVARLLARLPVVGGRVRGWSPPATVSRGAVASIAARMVLNFTVRAAGFVALAVAVGLPFDQVGRIVGAYAVGQVAGRLAVFAPGGLGPREGVTALILSPLLGTGGAVRLVAVARLVEVVAELAFLAIARVRAGATDGDTAPDREGMGRGVRGGPGRPS